jgi:DNA-binding transcriptional LysR family regulator
MDRFTAMKSLISVIENGSFSAAARRLDIGQPAISKSIAQLEKRLGVRLLVRSTRGFMPTEAGRKFYELARRAVAAAEDAEMAARRADMDLSGRLRVSAPATFASTHIVPRLKPFLTAHPDLCLDLMVDDWNIDLIEQGVDVAIRFGPLRDSSMTARKLATTRRLVLGSTLYFERAGVPRTPAELNQHEAIIHTQDSSRSTWPFRKGSVETAVKTLGRLRVSTNDSVRAAILSGMGYTIAPEWVFGPELESGAVRAVLADWTLPTTDIWAVFPTGRMTSAKARAFANFAEAGLQEARPAGTAPDAIVMGA